MKRHMPWLLAVLLLVSGCLAGAGYQYQQFLQNPLQISQPGLVVLVEPGTSVRSVLQMLEQKGVTRLDWRWRLFNRLRQVTIKAGEYELEPGMTPPALLDLLVSGKVLSYRFTIVEGWSLKQLIEELGRDPVLQHSVSTVAGLDGVAGFPAGNKEGWFLPETYAFIRGDSDLHILKRAYDSMQENLERVWAGRDTGLPYETPYELLIMASIIEKETSLESERSEIAGVFVRRLLNRWRLETDPTVIYGMGNTYQGNIRRQDLKQDTPYNTYTRHGLPPTPIALAGLASLQAAAHPAEGDAMFFVADGKGGHTFSITLDEHNKAVRQLIRKTKEESNAPESGQ